MNKICTIKIQDEVNCQVKGLDTKTNRRCHSKLKFKLPHARHLPSVKLGRWDGTVQFYSVGGNTQINLLDYIVPIITSSGYEIEIEDKRQPFDFRHPIVDKDFMSDIKWGEDHPVAPNQPIDLYEHQVKIINNFINNPQSIQTAPTSAGKTITCAALCRVAENYGRTFTVVPNKDLVVQTVEDYKMAGLDAGAYFGEEKEWDKTHTVCTWQSVTALLRRTQDGLTEEDRDILALIDNVNCVIVDEAHGAKGKELHRLMTTVFADAQIRWGLTGTIPKEEYNVVHLTSSIGEIVQGPSPKDLMDLGILSQCDIGIRQLVCDKKFNDFQEEKSYIQKNKEILGWLAEFVEEIRESGNVLILVNLKDTGKMLEKIIEDSVFIDGTVKRESRKEEYSSINKEKNKVIIATYSIASTGINIPRIFNLVIFEPGKSFIRTIQSIGRGLRKAHDKDSVNVYDICTTTKYSKRHLTERKKFYKECEYPFSVKKVDIKE